MTDSAAGFTIEEFVFEDLSETDQISFLELFNLIGAEREPRHTDYDKNEMTAVLNFPGEVRRRFLARDRSGRPIAHAHSAYPDDGTNPDLLKVAIAVRPSHRREGVGSALLETLVGVARDLDRSTLTSFVLDTVPAGIRFVAAVGGKRTLEHQSSVLPLAELSTDQMHQWVDDGPSRAPGYSVRTFEGAYPEPILDQMAHLYVVLERDMPTPEGHEPRNWNADRVVEFMEGLLGSGDMLTAVAFHDESGQAAGMSQLYRRKGDPKTWMVTTTMVDPTHRGRSLGKWLKGVVNLAALERWPEGEYAETGNAETNEAMLGINRAMGFRAELTLSEVALSVKAAEKYLASRRQAGGMPGTSSNGG